MTAISPDELRSLFLFERLDDEQLGWLAEHGAVRDHPEGEVIAAQGDPAELLFVLLDGEMALTNNVQGHEIEVTRSERPGVYGGAVQAYMDDQIAQTYRHSLRALRTCRMFELPAGDFGHAVREWFPMAIHLLEGLFFGMSANSRLVDQRERLTALGTITAGLTHELNNPAAAATRAGEELGERLARVRGRLAQFAAEDCRHLASLVGVQERLVERARTPPERSPLEISDAEDELADWLAEHAVDDAWELAPALVSAGFGIDDAEEVVSVTGAAQLTSAIRWLADVLEITQLHVEISDATARISGLVASVKQYSQLDRAPHQRADLHKLLDSTLVMLKRKIGPSVTVRRSYAPGLPPVPVYAAELNQVWTNLIVNALDAMGGTGTLTVRTARDGECVLVEIGDTGAGIPRENLPRIFTPFFTTKKVGEGTGLGLDISRRIVVQRHGGDLRVKSRPGDTRFQVLLPLTEGSGS